MVWLIILKELKNGAYMRKSSARKQLYGSLCIVKLAGRFLLIILIILTLSAIVFSSDNKYIGSKESNKYHYDSCRWVKNIKKENVVEFKTVKEAIGAGYEPCGTCKPEIEGPARKKKN